MRRVFGYVGWFYLVGILLSSGAWSATPRETKVLIVGAGLSGLSTAYHLKRAGVPFHILEAGTTVGSRVRTVHYMRPGKPLIYGDAGMEELWESNPGLQIVRELGLPTRSDVVRSSIILDGKLYPLKPDEEPSAHYRRMFGEEGYQAYLKFKQKIEPYLKELHSGIQLDENTLQLKDLSFAAFVLRENLPKKVADWIRITMECEIGTSWDKISALDGLAEFHILKGTGEKAYRVIGGNSLLTNALADSIGRENISTNMVVTAIREGNKKAVTYQDLSDNSNRLIEATHVVLTAPLFRLHEIQFEPELSEKKLEAISTMSGGTYLKAHVFVKPEARKYWTIGGESFLPVLTDKDIGVIYEANPEQPETPVLTLLLFGEVAKKFTALTSSQIEKEIKKGFDELWPGFSTHVEEMAFYRYSPYAIAAWPPGRSRFDKLSEEVRVPENRIYIAGDFTESSHSDGAFESAIRVASQIIQLETPQDCVRDLGLAGAK